MGGDDGIYMHSNWSLGVSCQLCMFAPVFQWVEVVICESDRCILMCIESCKICELGWGSSANEFWV